MASSKCAFSELASEAMPRMLFSCVEPRCASCLAACRAACMANVQDTPVVQRKRGSLFGFNWFFVPPSAYITP